MNIISRVNDLSQSPPRMEIHQSWWAMRGLGDANNEWSMEEKIKRVAAAGFTGILGRLPPVEEMEKWRTYLDKYRLQFGIEAFPVERKNFSAFLQQAQQFGVHYINAQALDSFVTGQDAIDQLNGLLEEAASYRIPLFIETHRGRVTQDLLRTAEYVQKIPDLRLTIDLSHYVLAGEMLLPNEKDEHYFDILLERTSCIHGRISNGEQIQVDIGPNGEHPMTERFVNWWLKGMARWLEDAQSGDILPFVCELGPIPYSIARKGYTNPPEEEISKRWEQSLLLKRIAEQTWSCM